MSQGAGHFWIVAALAPIVWAVYGLLFRVGKAAVSRLKNERVKRLLLTKLWSE